MVALSFSGSPGDIFGRNPDAGGCPGANGTDGAGRGSGKGSDNADSILNKIIEDIGRDPEGKENSQIRPVPGPGWH